MRKLYVLLAICVATSAAIPRHERIVGGSIVDISRHPLIAAVLIARDNVNFRQECGSTIINNRSVLSAAHCWAGRDNPPQFRIRAGSTNAHSGGFIYNVAQLITHPNYNVGAFQNNDIGIVRLTSPILFGTNVRVGSISGPDYNLQDNELVWAIGWGLTGHGEIPSEQLRQVQLRTINQETCRGYWSAAGITETMLCAGWHEDGRGICSGDSGGPLIHGNVVVGVVSMGGICGEAIFPGIFVRVSKFTNWIQSNA